MGVIGSDWVMRVANPNPDPEQKAELSLGPVRTNTEEWGHAPGGELISVSAAPGSAFSSSKQEPTQATGIAGSMGEGGSNG